MVNASALLIYSEFYFFLPQLFLPPLPLAQLDFFQHAIIVIGYDLKL